jgi:hypothetical protein
MALLRDIEAMGVRGNEAHWRCMPPELVRRLEPRTAHLGDAFVTSLSGSESLRMNRVIGLGHRGRAKRSTVDDIIRFYQDQQVDRFSISLSPGPQSAKIAPWLMARGFSRRPGLVLLVRDARGPLPVASPGIAVHRAAVVDRPRLGGGATRTRWRRRGAHHALILARLRRAASLGCRWVWVETAAPARGRPDGSRRNLLRLGFREVAGKPLFVWERR